MNFFRRLRELISTSNTPEGVVRTLPTPVRARIADHETPGEQFTHIEDWSSFTPAPPSWELPDIAGQLLWIDGIITSHAEQGSLDGFVPDLLDRWIAHERREYREKIESAHTHARWTQQRLYEQAKIAQTTLAVKLIEAREELTEAERGYERAYEFLTWEKPVRAATPRVVNPALIQTEIARLDAHDEERGRFEPRPLQTPMHNGASSSTDDPDSETPAAALAV